MDLSMLKQKLDTLQQKQSTGQKRDYSLTFWRPTVGKQQIRIVPSAINSKNPFTELKFYYGITNKVMVSPLNFGEKDPIALFASKLREEYNKENYVLAKKLDAKTRIFAPVIVRGEEAEGVQMWEFGKEIYEAFLQMAADEEVGDFTDIMNGRDIKLTTVGPDTTGTPYNRTTISPSMKQTQLSSDSNSVETWLDDQQNPKETYKPLPFDDIKAALQEWLAPEDEEGEITSEPAVGFDDEKSESNYSLSTKEKKSKVDKFDEMFDDDMPF